MCHELKIADFRDTQFLHTIIPVVRELDLESRDDQIRYLIRLFVDWPRMWENSIMRSPRRFSACLIVAMALLGSSALSVAYADIGAIWISEIKGGRFIGASGGSGTLVFHGR